MAEIYSIQIKEYVLLRSQGAKQQKHNRGGENKTTVKTFYRNDLLADKVWITVSVPVHPKGGDEVEEGGENHFDHNQPPVCMTGSHSNRKQRKG